MEAYKPKRFEFKVFDGYNRSLGGCITRERWDNTKDYYIYLNLWWFNITFVFLRFNNNKDE